MTPIDRAYEAVKAAVAPSRQLDAIVAATLSPDMLWRGERLKNRHQKMAFTRGLENAERFLNIALPSADWNVGNHNKDNTSYCAMIWINDGPETDAFGSTPALALIIATLRIGQVLGGFPIFSAILEAPHADN